MYSAIGRPSIPPERLLKSSLLMALYTVRSERLFCEQLAEVRGPIEPDT
jgi:transposase